MSKISKKELKGIDFDWYCLLNNEVPAHFASMGGFVPSLLCERKELRTLEASVLQLPYICDITLTDVVDKEIKNGYDYLEKKQFFNFDFEVLFSEVPSFNYNLDWDIRIRLYACSFVDKARRGFYSYARIGDGNNYALIAKPKKMVNWKSNGLKLINLGFFRNWESINFDYQ